jgi:hypothetical protein
MSRTDRTDRKGQGRDSALGTALGSVAVVLFMVVWFTVGTWSTLSDWNIVMHGIHTTGTVLRAGFCGGDGGMGAYILYMDRAGREHRVLSQSCNAGYHEGDAIALLYLPDDPDRIITTADIGDLRTWTIALVASYVVALLVVVLVVWWLLWGRRSR